MKFIFHCSTKIKKQFFCFFLFAALSSYSQNKITGVVVDSLYNTISGTNITLKRLSDNALVDYSITDNNGQFLLDAKNGIYILKISYIGFSSKTKDLKINGNDINLGKIILYKSLTALDEVIIKAKNNGVVLDGDKTSYKIEKFLNGTEDNLEDIIEKLPGLGINDAGKVTANGKEVDKLLIEGEDLYKRQHQFATKNIDSDMVKNIELIRNYKAFETITKNDSTGITALNVNIKDEFKNKFTGNILALAGIRSRYNVRAPVFNFNKKIKFSLISNLNNSGETPITIDDYRDLINQNNEANIETSNVTFTNLENLPRFLSSGNNVESRKTQFHTLSTIANLNKKTKLKFYSIYNKTEQDERFFQNTRFPSSTNAVEINEAQFTSENNYFFTAQLDASYKFSENTILSLSNTFSIDNTRQNNFINNNSSNDISVIEESFQPNQIAYRSELSFKKNIKRNSLSSGLIFDYNQIKNEIGINSNNPFLELIFSDVFNLSQSFFSDIKNISFNNTYSIPFEKISLSLKSNYALNSSRLSTFIEGISGFNNNLKLKRFYNSTGFDFSYKPNKTLKYSLGLDYNYIVDDFNGISNTLNYFGINSNLKATFNSNAIGNLSYKYSRQLPTIENLNQNFIIQDYRNVVQNGNLASTNLLPVHQINFSQFFFKPQKHFSLIVNGSYSFQSEAVNNNIINSSNVTLFQNTLVNVNNMLNTFLFFEKGLGKIPLALAASISYNKTRQNYLDENVLTDFESESLSNVVKIKSKFEKSPIHFEIGYQSSFNSFINNEIQTRLKFHKPYMNFEGEISKFVFWKLKSSLTNFSNGNDKRSIFILSPEVKYNLKNTKIDLFIRGNNILNLNNQNIIENNSSSSFSQERITNILNGYLITGLKIKF